MQERDDTQLFTYEHNGYKFCFRFLDTNIKAYDNGKHFHYTVPVYEQDNKVKEFIVSFRVEADEIDAAYSKTIENILKEIQK